MNSVTSRLSARTRRPFETVVSKNSGHVGGATLFLKGTHVRQGEFVTVREADATLRFRE
jgi:hypothetical protein